MMFWVTLCSPEPSTIVTTIMPKYGSQLLDSRVRLPWLIREMHMSLSPCCSNGIVNGSREQTLGYFKRNVAESGCHLRQKEPESQWQTAAEGVITEQKIGSC